MGSDPAEKKYVFGPVPSRRLGRSLGVDLATYKTCSFDCIYCDLGRTTHKTISRQSYLAPEEIQAELVIYLSRLDRAPDYVTLAGSGEPTLNANIGEIIHRIKESTSIPVAVLTNSSLLSLSDVRKDLLEADLVLPSLDAITSSLFKYISRPHASLRIEEIISGLVQFRKEYRGQIWLELFFCMGVNDGNEEIEKLRKTIERIHPDRIQLNTAVRPPVEDFVFPLNPIQLENIRTRLGENAEVISEFVAPLGDRLDSVTDLEILNLIRRRPSTAEDVSRALGLRLEETMKHLVYLNQRGAIRYRMFEHRCYFEPVLAK
jgi:wyosine [tRNA(Phe)-imidazoG37] synthetase (radical SAM superfamily)